MKVRTQVTVVLTMIAALLAATPGVGAQESPPSEMDKIEAPASGSDGDVRVPVTSADVRSDLDEGLKDAQASVTSRQEFLDTLERATGKSAEDWAPLWAQHRETYGFNDLSPRQLVALAGSEQGQVTMSMWDLPLRQEEANELADREVHFTSLERVLEVAKADANFSSVTSSADGAKLITTIRFTEQVSAALIRELNDLVDDNSRLELRFDGQRTLRELEEIQRTIVQQKSYRGASIHSVTLDPETETVLVSVRSEDARAADLSAGIDGTVQVVIDDTIPVESQCTSRKWCGDSPYRGGIALYNPSNNVPLCTTGFNMMRSGVPYLSTAAHCAQIGQWFKVGQPVTGGTVPGFGALAQYQVEAQFHDVGLMRTSQIRSSNILFKNYSNKAWPIWSAADPGQNESGCIYGHTIQRVCGVVSNPDVPFYTGDDGFGNFQDYLDGFEIDVWAANVNGQGWWCADTDPGYPAGAPVVAGTSGGSVTSRWATKALGVVSACSILEDNGTNTNIRITAVKIEAAEASLNAVVRTYP